MPRTLKKTRCKGGVEKEWEQMEKIPEWAADESQKSERGDRWSKEQGQKSSFCVIDGSVSSQEFGAGTSVSKVQRQCRTPRWHCKRWFCFDCSIHWTRTRLHPKFQTARARRTSSWCSIRLWKMHRRHQKIQTQNVPDIWMRLPTHKWQNHGPAWKIRLFLSKGTCTVILWQDYHGKSKLRKFELGMFLLSTEQEDYSHQCMWTPAILLCGKHSTTMQIGTVSRLRFCRRSWGFKIYIRWNIMRFGKSYICSNQLDVQETDFSLRQLHRSWNHFSWCRFAHERYSRSHSLGFGGWSIWFCTEPNRRTQERATVKPDRQLSDQTCITPSQSSTPTSFQQTLITFHQSPTTRHVSRTHSVALDRLFERINLDPNNSNRLHWHQTPTRRYVD